jgi:hypothetical protein
MRVVPILGVVVTACLAGVISAHAGSLRRECSQVNKVATIQYPPSLILNVYGDSSQKTCAFYVSLPPDLGDSKGAQAVQILGKARSDYPDRSPALEVELQKNFAPALIAALIAPLSNAEVKTDDSTELLRRINDETATINQCASNILLSGEVFEQRSALISCGRVDAAVFALEARYESASLGIELPVQ